jgi:hypothetical protein
MISLNSLSLAFRQHNDECIRAKAAAANGATLVIAEGACGPFARWALVPIGS